MIEIRNVIAVMTYGLFSILVFIVIPGILLTKIIEGTKYVKSLKIVVISIAFTAILCYVLTILGILIIL